MSVRDEESTSNHSENNDNPGIQDVMMYEYEIDNVCSLHYSTSNRHEVSKNTNELMECCANNCSNNCSSHFEYDVRCKGSGHHQRKSEPKTETYEADNHSFAVASTYTSSTVANTTLLNVSLQDSSSSSSSNSARATTRSADRLKEEKSSTVDYSSSSSSSSASTSLSCSFGRDPEQTASYAAIALALTVQDWSLLGTDVDVETSCTGDLEILVDRITSLLLVRIAAVAAANNSIRTDQFGVEDLTNDSTEMHGWTPVRLKTSPYTDYSTSTICRTLLMQQQPWHSLTPTVTPKVIDQLRLYVHRILSGYNDVPYHSREHAFHVVLSTNKLLDMMLQPQQSKLCNRSKPTPTYGLRQEPIQLLGLVFAALVHDVEHLGLPNRQLALESNPLAIQYNDFSVAEQRSLYIAFRELLQDDYIELRTTMFGTPNVGVESEEYRRFRNTVVNLVLNTDIASPERTQLSKSKWKEAFGEKVKRTDGTTKKNTTTTTASTSTPAHAANGATAAAAAEANPSNNNEQQPQSTSTVPSNDLDDEPIRPPTRALNRERSRTESSEDEYTIPITPDMSECIVDDLDYDDDDEDDGVIFHSSLQLLGTSTSAASPSNVVPNVAVTPTNIRIHQSQLDKLEYLIRLSTRKASISGGGGSNNNIGYESYHGGEDLERQTLYGTTHKYEPAYREGRRIQKSSSLPGKLNPPVPVIEFEQYHLSTAYPRQRQMSAPHCIPSYRKRLGIRRSMDLSGEALETYNRKRQLIFNYMSTSNHVVQSTSDKTTLYFDQPDELKASVVLELILTAADVAHNLQGWEQMVKWSGRLYMELRKAFVNHRSVIDPKTRWYENQIGFLESYLIPLAQNMIDTGVFNNSGVNFVDVVKSNRDQWMRDGATITETIILAGDDRFPLQTKNIHLTAATSITSKATSNAEQANVLTNDASPTNDSRPSPTRGLCKSHCTPSGEPATLVDTEELHSNAVTTMEVTENVRQMISREGNESSHEEEREPNKAESESKQVQAPLQLTNSNSEGIYSNAPIRRYDRKKKSKKSKDPNEVFTALIGFFEPQTDEVPQQSSMSNTRRIIVTTIPVESNHVGTPLPNYFGYLLTEMFILVMVVIICVLVVSDAGTTSSNCSEVENSY